VDAVRDIYSSLQLQPFTNICHPERAKRVEGPVSLWLFITTALYKYLSCGQNHNQQAKVGATIAEWPETPTWKPVTAVLAAAVLYATFLTWQIHNTKAAEQKFAEHARAYRVRAELGDPKAESSLAYMYSHGQGVPQDYDEALRWRRKAADQGNADGEDGLGYMYSHGLGVPQDYVQSLLWYRKAADQGNADAQNAVALIYEQGDGVPQDYAEALRWYLKAANQRYAPAEYNLGNMYYYGHGVQHDPTEAVHWYQKAADHGDEYAQQVLHIKWKGMSTPTKISRSITFLGSLLIFASSLMPRERYRGKQQRTLSIAGLLGFSYLALDLLGFRYIGILAPLPVVGAFSFFKSLLSGTFLALLLAVVSPDLWSKFARIIAGLFGILFIGFNVLVIVLYKLRTVFPPLRSFWSLNGDLLGVSLALAVAIWLNSKHREQDPIESDLQS